jgi:ATPase subunit of ABC transporter with duplicated ATPase domains
MSHVLTLANLSAARPDSRLLFSDLSLSVGVERIGLVGRNGSGKSTLLDIVEGRATPVAGTVYRAGSVGRLAQHWPDDQAVAHGLGVADALATLARIEAGAGRAEDFDTADWALPAVVESALDDVDLKGVDLDASMGALSGGERTRIGIARLLIDRPDLLLLDEPTNNLDRAGRDAIQRLVARWYGGVLVASHDRVLLEAVDRIVELGPVGIRIVGGGWTEFVAVRDAERTQAKTQRDRADAALRRTRYAAQVAQEAKDRRDKAGRAFAAKGSGTGVDRLSRRRMRRRLRTMGQGHDPRCHEPGLPDRPHQSTHRDDLAELAHLCR